MNDPNWLYSTIAQSSAAIVAIIGGFITASLLMSITEKRNLTHQKADKDIKLKVLEQEERRLCTLLETLRVDRFIESITDDLKKEDTWPSFEEIRKNHPETSNLEPSILRRELEGLNERRLEAREFMEAHTHLIGASNLTLFKEWIKENELDIPLDAYTIYQNEYDRLSKQKREIVADKSNKVRFPWLMNISSINLIQPVGSAQYDIYHRDKQDRILEDVKHRLDIVRQDILISSSEIDGLNERLEAFRLPPNLWWGIGILGYLAIFGIFFPLLMMFHEVYIDIMRGITLYCFYAGLLGLFAYIAFQINSFRRK